MDRKLFVALLMSAGLATLVAAMFYRLTSARASGSAPQLVSVVYAASSLPVGARVRPSDVKLISIPASVKPRDSFARVEDVVDRPVIAAIMQDEPVLKQRLSEPGSGAGLAPIIPAGFRAVSLRVNDVIGVAGYAEPGMKVDVLVTGHPPQSDETITRTVLQNIPVLSAGEVLQPEPKGQAINATLVTLQVTPREAELLALASDGGHIQLVLRNSTDLAIQNTSGAELSAMYGITRPHAAPASPPKPHAEGKAPQPPSAPVSKPAAAPESVEVIRGTHRALEPVYNPAPAHAGTH